MNRSIRAGPRLQRTISYRSWGPGEAVSSRGSGFTGGLGDDLLCVPKDRAMPKSDNANKL